MDTPAAGLRSRIALDSADRAVLLRLRAIALLFATAAWGSALRGIDIALLIDRFGQVVPLAQLSPEGRRRIAEAAGWSDLLPEREQRDLHALYRTTCHRTAQAELPQGCPTGLFRLLRRIDRHPYQASAASLSTLAQAGWGVEGRCLIPLLPGRSSAQERLDALTRAEEAGGLGEGPLGRLAAQVVAQLGGGG